jgi:hypothetical protein
VSVYVQRSVLIFDPLLFDLLGTSHVPIWALN